MNKVLSAALLIVGMLPVWHVVASPWESVEAPSRGSSESIGSYSNGCLAGAQSLPLVGNGYQVMRSFRERYYGHREMIVFLKKLSEKAKALELGHVLVGDIAMPRGGRFSSGHASHQTGLDADIWLKLADRPMTVKELKQAQPVPMVKLKQYQIHPENWGREQALLVQLAASDEKVARIFVHPVIKEQLCQREWTDRSWLRKVRPWWGHYYHFHVRLHCPEGSGQCQAQKPPPPGDGCGTELASWRPDPNKKPAKVTTKKKKRTPPSSPDQCLVLLRE